MNKIKVLPISEAQKIAAGEVIERPANVVKELIENSIDAGANQISLYLEESGKKLIRISDNGCGMSEEDAKNSILHHATSKITTIDDLDKIITFGFRGEALSSIASVSKMNLITKNEESPVGISLEIDQANLEKTDTINSRTGTDIYVKDIFFNVPVRKKFLKTNETEWKNISQLFEAFALSNLHISFKLYHNDKLIYNYPAAQNITERLTQIYDFNFVQNILILEPNSTKNNFGLSGAISTPKYTRYDRNQIFLFVNKRWVKNYKLAQALINGYEGMLAKGQYPSGFIFIDIDTKEVDINIHPRKEEVKFLHPKIIENYIKTTVTQRLETYSKKSLGQINVEYKKQQNNVGFTNLERNINAVDLDYIQKPFTQVKLDYSDKPRDIILEDRSKSEKFLEILNKNFDIKATEDVPANIEIIAEPEQKEIIEQINYKIIAQVLNTYILIETSNGLSYIDQHAAHERIIYEQLKSRDNNIETIKLLFPQIINLNNDINQLLKYLDIYQKFGFFIEQFSKTEIIITQAPIFLKNLSFENLIKETISLIEENTKLGSNHLKFLVEEKLHAQIACSSAVRSGDLLSIDSMQEIIKKLYNTKNMLTCPHGRPTIWELSKFEIEKKFKRDYR